MAFLITSLIASVISLYIFSIKQAVVYGLAVLLFVTFGKILLMLPVSFLPYEFRVRNIIKVERIAYIFAYIVFIAVSYWFNSFLIIPSIAVCLIDYYWKRESDKIIRNG